MRRQYPTTVDVRTTERAREALRDAASAELRGRADRHVVSGLPAGWALIRGAVQQELAGK